LVCIADSTVTILAWWPGPPWWLRPLLQGDRRTTGYGSRLSGQPGSCSYSSRSPCGSTATSPP